MDATLKNFFDSKKALIKDTKLIGSKKQKVTVPKAGKDMNKPLDDDPYRRFASSAIKDKPSKKDLIEKVQQFIDAEEAQL